MFRRTCILLFTMLAILLMLAACGGASTTPAVKSTVTPTYAPDLNPANFVATITNPYLPLKPGTTFISEGTVDGVKVHREVTVTSDTKVIDRATCIAVKQKVWSNGKLAEETTNWYAQDQDQTVWHLGAEVKAYQKGVTSTQGSWEAGVNGATPGITMPGKPTRDVSYYTEYLKGETEDMDQVVSLTEAVTIPYGSFSKVIKIKESSQLTPGVIKYKYYAQNVGLILTTIEGKTGQEKLLKVTTGNAG
ncbi:MAG: hypothetical protein E6J34_10290 [Chloroflexi bacterium]|nr:MAG: hypothetical protein E6J34_10290 [Chloroflexota bacterium]